MLLRVTVARIQRRLDTITPAQFVNLRKIYNSLKDEMSKPEDWFPAAAPAPSGDEAPAAPGKSRLATKLSSEPSVVPPPVSEPSDPVHEAIVKALMPYDSGFPKLFAKVCGEIGLGVKDWRTAPDAALRTLKERLDSESSR